MADILPPAPVDAPFGAYNWVDWYKKVRDAINNAGSVAWAAITGKPNSLAGYGIIDGVPDTRTITTTAPLTGGGDLSADISLFISDFTGSTPGAVPTSLGGTTNYLRADGAWASPGDALGAASGTSLTLSGDITTGSGTLHKTSAPLTNAAAAQIATLLNAPVAGNPTKWIPIDDNGTTRYIPVW